MKYLHDLKEMICEELEEYARKGELSAGSLDVIHEMTDTVKNIDKILMLEGYGEGDESYEGGSYAGRRGAHYVRGHYSHDGGSYDGGIYRNGSRERGRYSRDDGKGRMMGMVDELMNMASDEKQRTAIRQMKEELERI